MNKNTFIYLFVLGVCCIYASFNFHKKGGNAVIYSDPEGYYMYLPALFIYNGFEGIPIQSQEFTVYPGTNKVFTKYTYGIALMEMPFFVFGHLVALGGDYPADGYSYPYRVSIMMAAIFYMLAGLYLLILILRKHFKNKVIFTSLTILLLGTNLYFYTIGSPGASHVFIFFQFALFLFCTDKILTKKTPLLLWGYASLYALIVISRPTNAILILIPLLYNCKSLADIKVRILYLISGFKDIGIIVFSLLLVALPQIVYWHYLSGNWILYSYQNQGFDYWKNPQILNVLFSVWSGWFIYTPLAVLLVIQLIFLSVKNINNSRVNLLIIGIALYLFASWWYWWFGGSFGHRCFVEFYVLLAFALTSFVDKLFSISNKYITTAGIMVLAVLVYYNIAFTYLYKPPWDGPNWTWDSYYHVLQRASKFDLKK